MAWGGHSDQWPRGKLRLSIYCVPGPSTAYVLSPPTDPGSSKGKNDVCLSVLLTRASTLPDSRESQ